jgi:CHAT domain-containing protein/tetratricopeptide (TPR) repeat protein
LSPLSLIVLAYVFLASAGPLGVARVTRFARWLAQLGRLDLARQSLRAGGDQAPERRRQFLIAEASVLEEREEFALAVASLAEVLSLRTPGAGSAEVFPIHCWMGELAEQQDQHRTAIRHYDMAYRAADNPQAQARALEHRGEALLDLGLFVEAEETFRRVDALDRLELSERRQRMDHLSAVGMFRQVLDPTDEGVKPDENPEAPFLLRLARCRAQFDAGQLSEALQWLERADDEWVARAGSGAHPLRLDFGLWRARILLRQARWERATNPRALIEEAVRLLRAARGVAGPLLPPSFFLCFAEANLECDRFDDALANANEACRLADSADRITHAQAARLRGAVAFAQLRILEGRRLFDKARAIYRECGAGVAMEVMQLERDAATVEWAAGHRVEAIECARAALAALTDLQRLPRTPRRVLEETEGGARAWVVLTAALAAEQRFDESVWVAESYRGWQLERMRRDALETPAPETPSDDLAGLLARVDGWRARSPDELLLAFQPWDEGQPLRVLIASWRVAPSLASLPIGRAEFASLLLPWLATESKGYLEGIDGASNQIGALLLTTTIASWVPLRPKGEQTAPALATLAEVLNDHNDHRVAKERDVLLRIVPSSLLGHVPFAALPLSIGGPRLIERFLIVYSTSLRSLDGRPPKGRCDGEALLVAGGPGDVGGLEFAAPEADAISLHWKGPVRRVGSLTRDDFRGLLPGCDLVHLACHARAVLQNPFESTIELPAEAGVAGGGSTPPAGSMVTVGDVLSLRLRTGCVVALSACQTAMSASGVESFSPVSLATAFLGAGAEVVVATLWNVPDESSADLMRAIYVRVATGTDWPMAIAEAQRDMLRQKLVATRAQGPGNRLRPAVARAYRPEPPDYRQLNYWASYQVWFGG